MKRCPVGRTWNDGATLGGIDRDTGPSRPENRANLAPMREETNVSGVGSTEGLARALKARLAPEDHGLVDSLVSSLREPMRAIGDLLARHGVAAHAPPSPAPLEVPRVTPAQWRVLRILGAHRERGIWPRVGDVAGAIGCRPQTVLAHMARLGESGLLVRRGRARWAISEAGLALLAHAVDVDAMMGGGEFDAGAAGRGSEARGGPAQREVPLD